MRSPSAGHAPPSRPYAAALRHRRQALAAARRVHPWRRAAEQPSSAGDNPANANANARLGRPNAGARQDRRCSRRGCPPCTQAAPGAARALTQRGGAEDDPHATAGGADLNDAELMRVQERTSACSLGSGCAARGMSSVCSSSRSFSHSSGKKKRSGARCAAPPLPSPCCPAAPWWPPPAPPR